MRIQFSLSCFILGVLYVGILSSGYRTVLLYVNDTHSVVQFSLQALEAVADAAPFSQTSLPHSTRMTAESDPFEATSKASFVVLHCTKHGIAAAKQLMSLKITVISIFLAQTGQAWVWPHFPKTCVQIVWVLTKKCQQSVTSRH